MRKKFCIYLIIILSLYVNSSLLFCQNYLQAVVSCAVFNSPAEGSYIETYLSIRSNSCIYIKNKAGKYNANVNVTIIFKQDTIIKNFKKYNLESPEANDTNSLTDNFLDIQRFLLPNGNYDMEIKLADNNGSKRVISRRGKVNVNFSSNTLSFSDIELVDSYSKSKEDNVLSKSGYDIVPHGINFYSRAQNKLIFYSEIYNAQSKFGKDKKFLLKYFIESDDNKFPIDGFVRTKKEVSKPVNVILSEFEISELLSGNYDLVIEARDSLNNLVASSKLFFQRSKPSDITQQYFADSLKFENSFAAKITNVKELDEYLEALYPISTNMDYQYTHEQLRNADIKLKQKYFYNFWFNRNHENPEKAWLAYLEEVKKVNTVYSTRIKKGFLTDRGRVYLQYGPPNTIYSNENEPSAYPYEIWHYYSLGNNQTNKKFVFYARDAITNDYQLLHSDATGEINNPQWEIVLYGRTTPYQDIDLQTPTKHYGSQVEDYYNQPR